MAYFGGTVSERAYPRFNLRLFVLFLVASAGIVASLVLGRQFLLSRKDAPVSIAAPAVQAHTPQKVPVFVATENIPAGRRLSPAMFRMEYREVEGLQDKVVASIADFEGQYARVSLSPDSLLFRESVAQTAAHNNIISQIPAGYRAVAIPVNVVTGVEGWVQPGARVDVVWSTTERGETVVTTLVENAQVLSAERSMEPTVGQGGVDGVPNHISLLVTTKDAQKIQLAKGSGSLSLSLRGEEDLVASGSETLRADSLLKNRYEGVRAIQGRVRYNGEDFVLQAGRLIPVFEYEQRLVAAGKH